MSLVDALRAEGHAAAVSGAGPSVLVLTVRAHLDLVRAHAGPGWWVLAPGIPGHGVRVRVLDRG
jgi:homoserine kinase